MAEKFSVFHAAQYRNFLRNSLPSLSRRMDAVVDGRATPTIESIPIGSGRNVTAVIVFFDICGFTSRTSSDNPQVLKNTLLMLNIVIPAMMKVAYRFGGYVEKNTGDGLMVILGIERTDVQAANDALDVAEEMFFVLTRIVNPLLDSIGIEPVEARIGMDMGRVLISRIGLPNGTSPHSRNALTAVGPAANLACKFQGMANRNEIWCGDSIRRYSSQDRQSYFDLTTPDNWTWSYGGNNQNLYNCWRYRGVANHPSLIRV